MRILFSINKNDIEKVKDITNEDPIGRSSIYIKDFSLFKQIGDDIEERQESGAYLIIDGNEENCELAKEKLEGIANIIEGNEAEEILKQFDDMESSAMEGFGGIFS